MAQNYKASKKRNQDSNLGRSQSSAHNHYIIPSPATRIPTVEEDEVIYLSRSQRSGFGEKEKPEPVTSQYSVNPAAA